MPEIKIFDDGMQQDVERFFEACASELGWAYEPQGRHSDMTDVRNSYMRSGCFWCLYEGQKLIGTVAVRTIDPANKTAELKRLYLLGAYHGKGYGDMLFKTALAYAAQAGFAKICADTRKDRSASQHLMRKHGFKEAPRYNDNRFAELFFELELNDI